MPSYLNFDGVSGHMIIPGYKGVLGTRERSISFWIRTTQTTLATLCWWGSDVSTPLTSDGEQTRIRLNNGKVEIFGRGSYLRSIVSVNDGNWHHVVFTWTRKNVPIGHEDFSRASVYIDNVLDNGAARGGGRRFIQPDGSEKTPIEIDTPAEQDVVIGARPTATGTFTEFYSGDMNEFAIYKDVLSTGTIGAAYNGGVFSPDLLSAGQSPALEVWYRMGDDPGDSVPVTLSTGTMVNQQPFYSRNGLTFSGTAIV